MNRQFEYFQKEVTGMTTHSIQDLFSSSASDSDFQIISKTSTSSTAVYQEPLSLRSVISCIIPVSSYSSQITSVKLEILHDKTSTLVIIRSLSGDQLYCRHIIEDFKAKLQNLTTPNFFFYSKSLQSESNAYVEKPEISVNAASNENFKAISEHFELVCASDDVANVDGLVETAMGRISDSVFRFIDLETDKLASKVHEKFYNFSFVYCKSVIEKKVYSKLYPKLLEHYSALTRNIDLKFFQQKAKIMNMTSAELLKLLQVSSNFVLTGLKEPYEDAKVVLKRFNKLKTPIDKINCLIAAVACMKACVVEYWKGHLEIQAMDDELPVIMFLLLTSDIECPSAQLTILSNYVAGRLENEGRIILNFNSAVSYLSVNFNC